MPSVVLKRLVMSGLEGTQMDQQMVDATDFILERLESLGHAELASRLTLTCAPAHVEPQNVNDLPVTLIDVFDECALTQVGEALYQLYSILAAISRSYRWLIFMFIPLLRSELKH